MSSTKIVMPTTTQIPMGPSQPCAFAAETITMAGRAKRIADGRECTWEGVSLSFTPLTASSSASDTVAVNGYCTVLGRGAPVPCMIMGDYNPSVGMGSFGLLPLSPDADIIAAKAGCAPPADGVERFEFSLRTSSAVAKGRSGAIKLLFFSEGHRGVLKSARESVLPPVTAPATPPRV